MYINADNGYNSLSKTIYGDGYRSNVPVPDMIIHTLWGDKLDTSRSFSLSLDEIKHALKHASLSYNSSFANSPEFLKDFIRVSTKVSEFIGYYGNYIGTNDEIFQIKLKRLETLIQNYENGEDINIKDVENLFSLNLTQEQRLKLGYDYQNIVDSIEKDLWKEVLRDLKQGEDLQLIISGTKRGKDELSKRLQDVSSPGNVNTTLLGYHRNVTRMPVSNPEAPYAFIFTPRRTMRDMLCRIHMYLVKETNPKENSVRIKDSGFIDKKLDFDYLNHHYKLNIHNWDLGQENEDMAIINFGSDK